jgi:hypothetical protein
MHDMTDTEIDAVGAGTSALPDPHYPSGPFGPPPFVDPDFQA